MSTRDGKRRRDGAAAAGDGGNEAVPDRRDRTHVASRAVPAAGLDRTDAAEPLDARAAHATGGGGAAGGDRAGRRLQARRRGRDAGLADASGGGTAARRDGAVGGDVAAQPGPVVDDDAGGGACAARAGRDGAVADRDRGAVRAPQGVGESTDRPGGAAAPGARGGDEAGAAASGVGAAPSVVAPG